MHLAVHDYAGHPLATGLSRELARRGHTCHHLYCRDLVSPRGPLTRRAGDAESLRFVAVEPPFGIDKGRLLRRRFQESAYGRALVRVLDRLRPDALISANCPLDPQAAAFRWSRRRGVRFVFWVQDLLGLGSDRVLRRRLGRIGGVVGAHYRRLETRLLGRSDAVVLISEDFRPFAEAAGCRDDTIRVIENWGPLEELPVLPRDNRWARQHGLAERHVLLYCGTLGMKHDPALLVGLAERLRQRDDVCVVVVSEGTGADWLREQAARRPDLPLLHLGFEPFERLAEVLATADVLLALLEPEAGVFSVPSKVLSGLCAGRAMLLAVPRENLAARIVADQRAGLVVPPGALDPLVAAAGRLLDDAALRDELGENARRYAERTFDIGRIADRFEPLLLADPILARQEPG